MTDFLAGLAAGTAACYVGHPFDTVKTLIQLEPARFNSSATTCLRTVVRQHGLAAMYRGVSLPLASSALVNGVIFQITEDTFKRLKGPDEVEKKFDERRLLAGGLAGVLQSFIVSPLDLLKCRMQAMRIKQQQQQQKLESLRDTFKRTSFKELLYNGLMFTMLRDAPAYALYFYFFYGIKTTYNLQEPVAVSDLFKFDTLFLATTGGLCGCLGWILCYPVDVLKSRKQVTGRSVKLASLEPGWWYRGISPALVRTFPVNMVRFTVYLLVKNNLNLKF